MDGFTLLQKASPRARTHSPIVAGHSYFIGISGWNYPGWRGRFYPKKLAHRLELIYASRLFSTIEVNGTFYSLKTSSSFERWYDSTPPDFVFSLKGPRYITHMKRLKDPAGPLANFFASGVLALKEKLGPILWQLPPNFAFDASRLDRFFEALPKTTRAAGHLAHKTDKKFRYKPYWKVSEQHELRYALEVRHPSFLEHEKELRKILHRHNIALVCVDAARDWPVFREPTADFAYARLHGGKVLYSSIYSLPELKRWAHQAKEWHRGGHRAVFIYFDNDSKVHAPFDAQRLAILLKSHSLVR